MTNKLPFSTIRKSKDFYYVSGAIGVEEATGVVPEDFSLQVQNILEKFDRLLASVGLTKANIVKINIFLTEMANFQRMNEVYRQFFADSELPARTCVEVSALPHPDATVEMDLIAEV